MQQFDNVSAALLFCLFFIEFILILLHRPGRNLVRDIGANFVLGVCIIIVGVFAKAASFTVFSFVYAFKIISPDPSLWLWIAAFFCCDFIHYGYHWLGHKTKLFWAAHVTHHSSEYFNLSTGLRTNFIHLFYRFLFWSPLCLFGVTPEMILFFESISAIQNFLVHTEKIGKPGVPDWMFNTPSNHRVHHATNPEYIDKNLGGILMIYDHLFGTYAKELAPPVYGITHNIHSFDPVKILLHEYAPLLKALSTMKRFSLKCRFLFSRPE